MLGSNFLLAALAGEASANFFVCWDCPCSQLLFELVMAAWKIEAAELHAACCSCAQASANRMQLIPRACAREK